MFTKQVEFKMETNPEEYVHGQYGLVELLKHIKLKDNFDKEVFFLQRCIVGNAESFLPPKELLKKAEDFIVCKKDSLSRDWMGFKLGCLYIKTCCGGKGSFSLLVYIINKECELDFMFEHDAERYSGALALEDITGIKINNFVVTSIFRTNPEAKAKVAALKALMVEMAFGNIPDKQALHTAFRRYFSFTKPNLAFFQSALPLGFKKDNHDRDVPTFIELIGQGDVEDIAWPKTEFELAAKIAAYYFCSPGLSLINVSKAINHYLSYTKKAKADIDDAFITTLLSTSVDNGSYLLAALFPKKSQSAIIKQGIEIMPNPPEGESVAKQEKIESHLGLNISPESKK